MTKFNNYQALPNDYIIIHSKDLPNNHILKVEYLCNKDYDIASNGIFIDPYPNKHTNYKLQIFNSDDNEAKISGNRLCIFTQYLKNKFTIELISKVVHRFYHKDTVVINMGKVTFFSNKAILKIDNTTLAYINVDTGNPYCVVYHQKLDKKLILRYGSIVENHSLFQNKTNVQFTNIKDRENIEILIWERGTEHTLVSSSSDIISVTSAYHLELYDENITVHMPVGKLSVSFDEQSNTLMQGKVKKVFEGVL